MEKNARLVKVFASIGLDNLATKMENTPTVKMEEDFSPVKAWVEYANRLVGVLIGFFIIGTVITSFRQGETRTKIWSVIGLVLVVFIGWTGSVVVSTNLLPGLVTFHMSMALLLVAVLLYQHYLIAEKKSIPITRRSFYLILTLFILYVPQVLLGTQVREAIDSFVFQNIPRSQWIENLQIGFYIHRSYSLLLIGLMIAIFLDIRKTAHFGIGKKLVSASLILMIYSAVSGAIMAYMNVPAFIQPTHLLVAAVIFGLLFYLLLLSRKGMSLTP